MGGLTLLSFIKGVFITIGLFIMPVEPLILLVGLFIIGDTIMGLTAAFINKEPLLSRKFARLVIKLILYTSAVLLVYGLDILILSDIFGLDSSKFIPTKIAAGSLCVIEGFSIDEKIRKINNDKGIKYYWTKIIKAFKSFKSDINEINEK